MHCKFVQKRIADEAPPVDNHGISDRKTPGERGSAPSRPVAEVEFVQHRAQRTAARCRASCPPRLDPVSVQSSRSRRAPRRRLPRPLLAAYDGRRPGLRARLVGRGGPGDRPGLPEQLAHHRAGHPRDRRAALGGRLGRHRPRAVPAELPLPAGQPPRRPPRARQDLGDVLRRAGAALRVHRRPAGGADREGPRHHLTDMAIGRALVGGLCGLAGPALWVAGRRSPAARDRRVAARATTAVVGVGGRRRSAW